MNEHVALWGWDTAAWQKVRTDAAGHLQVDVITAGSTVGHCYGWTGAAWTPLLVESAGNANLRTRLYDGVNPIISVGTGADIADTNRGLLTQAVLRGWDGAFFKAVNVEDGAGDALDNARANLATLSKLYGYNGATWDRLRVESSTAFNLRVKLYDGANGIDSDLENATIAQAKRALHVIAHTYVHTGTNWYRVLAVSRGVDGIGTGGQVMGVASVLYGFNGADFDRLRSYGTGILKVGRAEVGLLDARLTATGQVGATGARKLYWMSINPGAGNSVIELTDAIAGGGAVVYDHFHTSRESHVDTLDPPMEFSNGIYLETFTNMTSVIFGYL